MIIRIGTAGDNDYVVTNDPHVSRHHAQLIHEEKGMWLLEDLDSTNGTFVNGEQVVKKRLRMNDKIRLGDQLELSLTQLLQATGDYSADFKQLKFVYDHYIEEKVKIQSSNQFKVRLMQAFPFALPGIIGVVVGFMGKGGVSLLVISLAVAVCAPAIGIYMGAKQMAKIPKLLQDLTNQFKIDYVCPKCGTFLGDIPWESLRGKKQCPICKARWVED